MSTPRPSQQRPGRHRGDRSAARRGLDDDAFERLLRGDPIGDPASARLTRLLQAAAAPATLDDLCHMDTIVAAYATHWHRSGATVGPGRTTVRVFGVKLTIAAVAATAAGSVAFAASAGILPIPLDPSPATSHATSSRKATPSRSALSPTPAPSASTAQSLAELCAAYQATTSSQRGQALTTPGFAPLVAAAGSAEKVASYCAQAAEHTPAPSVPSRRPTGRPTVSPSHAPPGHEPTRVPARQDR